MNSAIKKAIKQGGYISFDYKGKKRVIDATTAKVEGNNIFADELFNAKGSAIGGGGLKEFTIDKIRFIKPY